jgi:hypothetical protein
MSAIDRQMQFERAMTAEALLKATTFPAQLAATTGFSAAKLSCAMTLSRRPNIGRH